MNEFNNFNDFNNSQAHTGADEDRRTQGGYYYGAQGYPNMNEFSYSPKKPKKNAGKRVLTAVMALVCAAAIGTTSIVGYRLVTGKDLVETSTSQSNKAKSSKKDASSSEASSTINRDDLPTLEQLAAPADAMSIPDVIDKVTPSVVGVTCITNQGIATGSGIILSEDGYIITNAHVIEGAQSISVVLPTYYQEGDDQEAEDNLTVTAEKVGSDEQTDIAVLKIDRDGLVKAEIGKSDDVRVGELAIVIGNPLGLDLANTATTGIISAKDRTITVEDTTMKVFQTDASINSGNSGGALINAYGQVIGITSAKVASSAVEGLGFAIPIDDALPIITDLMENGYVTGRPSLGITGTDVTSAYSSYYGIPQGFMVASVTEGSGADEAGVQQNDIIIAINDTIVSGINELNEVKNTFKPGDKVTLTVYRNGKKLDLDVTLGESTGEQESKSSENESSDNGYGNGYGNDYGNGYFNPFGYFGGF